MSCRSRSLKLTVTWCVVLSLVTFVSSTLTPSGSVPIDCGGQQTFTCTVPGTAAWSITGLMGITATGNPAVGVAASARVTTPDLGLGTTSTITITGFSTSDDGGNVQCVDIGRGIPTVEGMATIAVGLPQCGQVGVEFGDELCPLFNFVPGTIEPTFVNIMYQLSSSSEEPAPTLRCPYPFVSNSCSLNLQEKTYTFMFNPENDCGTSDNCSSTSQAIPIPANCTLALSIAPDPVPIYILPAVIASVVLIIFIIIIIVVVLLVTIHCYKKSAKGGSSSRQEELYAQVEGKKVHEDIKMTDNPAYGPTSHAPPVYI